MLRGRGGGGVDGGKGGVGGWFGGVSVNVGMGLMFLWSEGLCQKFLFFKCRVVVVVDGVGEWLLCLMVLDGWLLWWMVWMGGWVDGVGGWLMVWMGGCWGGWCR